MLISEALFPHCLSDYFHTQPHPRSILHCSTAESLWWCSVMSVLIHYMQDATNCAPLLTTILAKLQSQTEWVSEHPLQRTDPHVPPSVPFVMLKVLIRTAPGKKGGRNTEAEVTTGAWHEGSQKLRYFGGFNYLIWCSSGWRWAWQPMML